MIKITEKQRLELAPLIPRLDELLAELDALCGLDKVKADVKSLINLVIDELDDSQNYLSEDGIKLQKLYDEIFESND